MPQEEKPPAEDPLVNNPPKEETPPKEEPPKENPPKDEPPKEEPPKEDPPKDDPPADDGVIEFDHLLTREEAQSIVDDLSARGANEKEIMTVLKGRRAIVQDFLDRNPGMAAPPTEATIRGDKSLGGKAYDENLTLVKRAVGEFGGNFDKLAKSGKVFDKEVFSMLVKAGKGVVGKGAPKIGTGGSVVKGSEEIADLEKRYKNISL